MRTASGPSARYWLVAWVLCLVGCATPAPVELLPLDREVVLQPDEGVLVVETDANARVHALAITPTDRFAPTIWLNGLASGRRKRLLVLPAGTYRWSEVHFQGQTHRGRHYPAKWILDADSDHWRFSVRAGVVNYPGVVVLQRRDGWLLRVYTLNRSGELLESLRARKSPLTSTLGLVYAGRGRDDFLEYYSEKLVREQKGRKRDDEPVAPPP